MISTLGSIRGFRLFLLCSPFILAGCQGEPTPSTVSHATSTDADAPPTPAIPVATGDHSTTEQPVASDAPELASTRDRATLEAAASEIHQDVQQTSNTVTQGVDDLKSGVTRAVGETQTQAKQAATDATDGVNGLVNEMRNGANQTVTDTLNEVKTSTRRAVDGAKTQVQSAVDGAKANARRRSKAVGDQIRKSAEGVKDEVLDPLLGPAPKN